MTTIQRFTSTDPTITAFAFQGSAGYYLWIAYEAVAGVCKLQKVSMNDLSQVYYELSITASRINKLHVAGNYVYALCPSADTYIAHKYHTSSPYTSTSYTYTKPVGLVEDPILLIEQTSSTNVWILVAGESGSNAQILKYNTIGTYLDTIDLDYSGIVIDVASSMVVEPNTGNWNIWVTTNESPAQLIRLSNWDDSGWRMYVNNIQA